MKALLFGLCSTLLWSFSLTTPTATTMKEISAFDSSMVIHLYHGGGMYYGSCNIYIRYDSCVRIDMDHGKEMITKFAMTPAMRETALEMLNSNKVYQIQTDQKKGITYDKATSQICIRQKSNKNICVSTSATTEIEENSKAWFYKLYGQIETFSLSKGVVNVTKK